MSGTTAVLGSVSRECSGVVGGNAGELSIGAGLSGGLVLACSPGGVVCRFSQGTERLREGEAGQWVEYRVESNRYVERVVVAGQRHLSKRRPGTEECRDH
jgi:hypothetical protein